MIWPFRTASVHGLPEKCLFCLIVATSKMRRVPLCTIGAVHCCTAPHKQKSAVMSSSLSKQKEKRPVGGDDLAKKKKKTKPVPDPEPASEEEEEVGEKEPSFLEVRAAKIKRIVRRKKAKLVGYRSLSRTAGYINTLSENKTAIDGNDCIQTLISVADAKRMMRFVPATPGAAGFSAAEFSRRLELCKASVPTSAARVTQAYGDAIFRNVNNQAVLRSVEAGKKTVSPSMMAAVLRNYAAKLDFTAVTLPIGVVRHAQDLGIMNNPDADMDERKEEKKDQLEAKRAYATYVEAEETRKKVIREKRAAVAAVNEEDRHTISSS